MPLPCFPVLLFSIPALPVNPVAASLAINSVGRRTSCTIDIRHVNETSRQTARQKRDRNETESRPKRWKLTERFPGVTIFTSEDRKDQVHRVSRVYMFTCTAGGSRAGRRVIRTHPLHCDLQCAVGDYAWADGRVHASTRRSEIFACVLLQILHKKSAARQYTLARLPGRYNNCCPCRSFFAL